jgi:hypothetical protein
MIEYYARLVDFCGVVFEPIHSWHKPFRQVGVLLFPLVLVLRLVTFLFLVLVMGLGVMALLPFTVAVRSGVWLSKTWKGEAVKW